MSDNIYVLSDSGHIALAKSILDQDIFLAWGKLIPKLDTPIVLSSSGVNSPVGALSSGLHNYKVSAYNDFGETLPSGVITVDIDGVNNAVNIEVSVVAGASGYYLYREDSGVYKRAATLVGQNTTLFTDTGTPLENVNPSIVNTTSEDQWTTTPPVANIKHTRLYNEVGRRRVVTKKFVKPDVNGDIDTPRGRWSESSVPTRYVYLQVGYSLTDAADQTIYQLGTFVGTTGKVGHENSNYLLPDQVDNPGTLFALSNVTPVYRNASTREIRELVITF